MSTVLSAERVRRGRPTGRRGFRPVDLVFSVRGGVLLNLCRGTVITQVLHCPKVFHRCGSVPLCAPRVGGHRTRRGTLRAIAVPLLPCIKARATHPWPPL